MIGKKFVHTSTEKIKKFACTSTERIKAMTDDTRTLGGIHEATALQARFAPGPDDMRRPRKVAFRCAKEGSTSVLHSKSSGKSYEIEAEYLADDREEIMSMIQNIVNDLELQVPEKLSDISMAEADADAAREQDALDRQADRG